MKKIIACSVLFLLLVVSLFACNKNSEDSNSDSGDTDNMSRTQKFYSDIEDTYFADMVFTKNGETYGYLQAKSGDVVTTVEDHDDDSKDTYCIYDGKRIDYIEFDKKYYDSTVTKRGERFIFDGYNASDFSKPETIKDADFNGKKYYCEKFISSSDGKNADSEDKYYYDGSRLVGIEIYSKGTLSVKMEIKDYGTKIPDNIIFKAPDDFSKGNLNIDTTVDASGWFDD